MIRVHSVPNVSITVGFITATTDTFGVLFNHIKMKIVNISKKSVKKIAPSLKDKSDF